MLWIVALLSLLLIISIIVNLRIYWEDRESSVHCNPDVVNDGEPVVVISSEAMHAENDWLKEIRERAWPFAKEWAEKQAGQRIVITSEVILQSLRQAAREKLEEENEGA